MSLESCLEIKVKIIPITINCTLTEPIAKKDPKDVTTKDATDETAKDRTARGMFTHISNFFFISTNWNTLQDNDEVIM